MSSDAGQWRGYHCELALNHFADKLESGPRRPYQAILLLHRLWLAVNNPWAEAPRVHVSGSRLRSVVKDAAQQARLTTKLAGIKALKKIGHDQRGTLYELSKPPVSKLSAEAQAEIANMHPADYRMNPSTKPRLVVVDDNLDPKIAALIDHRPLARRVSKKAITAKLAAINIHRAQIAGLLEKLIGKPRGSLKYSGPGSEAVQAACVWLVQNDADWYALAYTAQAARLDEREDKPEHLHFMFDTSSTVRAVYLAEMVQRGKVLRAAAEAKKQQRAKQGGE